MRKSILLIFGIALLQINSSCEKQYSISELNNNFSKEQISDLSKITEFFKENVCENVNSDFKTCYLEINHDSLQASGAGGIWTKIDFNKQLKLYEQISESTFNEIWMFCETTYYPSETKAKSLCAVATGKYQKYLADIGKKYPKIAKYAKRIQASGDFGNIDIYYQAVFRDQKTFDLKNPNIQLILAIQYLTMNDQVKRNAHLTERPKPIFE